jgi:hypothetical protein
LTDACTIEAAAATLGERPATLRRWVRDHGAPVVVRGRKGRGGSTLVDVDSIAVWRTAQTAQRELMSIASDVPGLIADAVYAAFAEIDSPRKREFAGVLPAVWYRAATIVLDRMRLEAPEIPDVRDIPSKITRLRCIFDDSRTVAPDRDIYDEDDEWT